MIYILAVIAIFIFYKPVKLYVWSPDRYFNKDFKLFCVENCLTKGYSTKEFHVEHLRQYFLNRFPKYRAIDLDTERFVILTKPFLKYKEGSVLISSHSPLLIPPEPPVEWPPMPEGWTEIN